MLAYVGVWWPILRAMWAHLVAMLAYVGLMLTHVEPKDPKNGNSKKNTVKRRIFWWSAAYLGAMWAHLGAMLAYLEGNVGPSWGYVGSSWGYVGSSWGYVGPSWGYLGPSWGYVGPSWGLCWPILRPMLAHVDPSWATRAEKGPKTRRAQNTVKRGTFWRPGWSAAGGAAPLSYGEERTAVRQGHGQGTERRELPYGKDTARGPLAGFKGCRPCRRPRKKKRGCWGYNYGNNWILAPQKGE